MASQLSVQKWHSQLHGVITKAFLTKKRNLGDLTRELTFPPLIFCFLVLFHKAFLHIMAQFEVLQDFDFIIPLIMSYLSPIFFQLAFAQIMRSVVMRVVQERKDRLYDTLKLMGLKTPIYWLGLLFSEAVTIGIVVLMISALYTSTGLANGFTLTFCLLFLFGLCCLLSSLLLSLFFENPKAAAQSVLIFSFVSSTMSVNLEAGSLLSSVVLTLVPNLTLSSLLASIEKPVDLSVLGQTASPPPPFLRMLLLSFCVLSFLLVLLDKILVGKMSVAKAFRSMVLSEKFNLKRVADNTSSSNTPLIAVKAVNKYYSATRTHALRDVSLDLFESEIVCICGPNGAGKSTLLHTLLGMERTDSGDVVMKGVDAALYQQALLEDGGVVLQTDDLFTELTGVEHVLLAASIKGLRGYTRQHALDFLNDMRVAEKDREKQSKFLSEGTKRKISIAMALLGDPRVVILDEPSRGVDPLSRRQIWSILESRQKDRLVILTTHSLEEAEVLGDRLVFMSNGQALFVGTPLEVRKRSENAYHLTCTLTGDPTSKQRLDSLVLKSVPSARIVSNLANSKDVKYVLPGTAKARFSKLMTELDNESRNDSESALISGYGLSLVSLEEVFRKLTTVGPSANGDNGSNQDLTQTLKSLPPKESISVWSQLSVMLYKRYLTARGEWKVLAFVLLVPCLTTISSMARVKMETKVKLRDQDDRDLDEASNLATAAMAPMLSVLFLFICITAVFVENIVRERTLQLRRVLMLSGMQFNTYWIGNWLSDVCLVGICISVIVATSYYFVGAMLDLQLLLLTVAFGLSCTSFGYVLSFLFANPSTAFRFTPALAVMAMSGSSFVQGLVTTWLIKRGVRNVLLLLLPMPLFTPYLPFLIGSLMLNDSMRDLIQISGQDIDREQIFQLQVVVLLVQSFVYLALSWIIDSRLGQGIGSSVPKSIQQKFLQDAGAPSVPSDVAKEVTAARNGAATVCLRAFDLTQIFRVISSTSFVSQLIQLLFPKESSYIRGILHVNLTVENHEFLALLGPNGSGKSTTMSVLSGNVRPTAGQVYVQQHEITGKDKTERTKGLLQLGFCPQVDTLWPVLTVEQHLTIFSRLNQVPSSTVIQLMNLINLIEHRNKQSRYLSGGNKRKLTALLAFICNPSVMLFDEPSAGLDPLSQQNLWTLIQCAARSGVITTHSMVEAELLCGRVGILKDGRLAAIGTPQQLKWRSGNRYRAVVRSLTPLSEIRSSAFYKMLSASFPAVQWIRSSRDRLNHTFSIPVASTANNGVNNDSIASTIRSSADKLAPLSTLIALFESQLGSTVSEYTLTQPTLEDVFVDLSF